MSKAQSQGETGQHQHSGSNTKWKMLAVVVTFLNVKTSPPAPDANDRAVAIWGYRDDTAFCQGW